MYRPFVTCDDPKGVVECGTIRRYRTNSQKMKDKSRSRRTAENVGTSLTNKPDKEEKVSKGSTERSFDPSSLQLEEVSRGAEKLNNMIESWSRGLRHDGSSEDIAKDLLKGALDLQESLEMLRKVQEASHKHNMARSKKKQDEKPERSRIDAKVMDRTTHSNQLGEQSYPMGVQRGWSSAADCSSSSCREELKKVIKESLVRQNLLPTTSSEGLDSASAFPSTNSSQSSVAWNDRLSDSSLSPITSRKERGPNLVAKLMGLEEVSSRSFPPVMQKQLESQKILNQKRPTFEIDMPKVRKNSSIVEKVNPERQQTLREILETTHFNGLLKKSPVREHKLHVHHSNDPYYKQFDDLPPVVLMKPRHTPYEPVLHPFAENCEQGQNSSGDDVLMLKYEHENDAIPAEDAHATISISETDYKPDKDSAETTSISETDFMTYKDSAELKYLLLTSQSFIDHAEELLNLDVDCPKILPKIETNRIANIRLYLDCANEITERKTLQESQVVQPLLLTCAGNSRLHISLGRLVEEVYNAIENLTSYCENSGKKLVLDNVYAMMERDMKCTNGLMNGIWNWGWRHGFSSDEAEQVVNEVENLVLSGLIEEVIGNL